MGRVIDGLDIDKAYEDFLEREEVLQQSFKSFSDESPEEKEARNLKQVVAKYGLTVSDYESMLKSQGGKCAICRHAYKRRLYVDHNHETGEVRGLLCSACNTLLGFAADSIELLRAAADYLETKS